MFETISIWAVAYSKAIVANPVLAMFAVYITGVLTYIVRNVPMAVYNTISTNVITTMTFNNAGYWEEAQYIKFLRWFMTLSWSKWSRHIHTGSSGHHAYYAGPGYGSHFFFIGLRLYWFTKKQLPSTGSEREKELITVSTFGRSQKPLLNLIPMFAPEPPPNTDTCVYSYHNSDWRLIARIPKRIMETVCVKRSIKKDLLTNVQRFVDDPDWFRSKGLPHKLSILFHGCPGSGKTSLIKALASTFNRDIYVIDLSNCSNSTFQHAVTTLGEKALVLLEDVDAATSAVGARRSNAKPKPSSTELTGPVSESSASLTSMSESLVGLTLSGLLNTLDGVIPMNDVILCMTTNHLDRLDPALIRKSRMDLSYNIGAMTNAELWDYIDLMYPDHELDRTHVFADAVGCDVQALFMENATDVAAFSAALSAQSKNNVVDFEKVA